MTFAENGVNLGLHRQFARLMRVVRSIFVAGSGHIGQGLERWPCQLAFGIWVASQMPNQVDRGVVFLPGKEEVCGFCGEKYPLGSVRTVLSMYGGAGAVSLGIG